MEIDGKQIKAAAALAGISLTDLADQLGLSRSTLYAYVSGVLKPSKKRVEQIAEATGTSLELFTRKSDAQESADADDTIPLVNALLSSENTEQAVALVQSRLDRIPSENRADLMLRLANSLAMDGHYLEALDWSGRARAEFESRNDVHSTGRCSQTLGFCYANVGPLRRAQACFEEAETRYNADSKWRAKAALAVVAERRGDYKAGLKMLDHVEAKFTESAVTLYCLGIRANILSQMGLWQEVLELENRALNLASEIDARDQIGERLISLILASIYTGSDDVEARVAHAQGFFQAHSDQARVTYFKVAQSLYQMRKGDLNTAFRLADQALESAIKGRFRRTELAAYLRLAEIAALENSLGEALTYARQAAAYSESYEYAGEQNYARALAGYIAAQMGETEMARQQLSMMESRTSWKGISPIVELMDVAVAVLDGKSASYEQINRNLREKGVFYAPVFQTADLAVQG